MRQIVMLARRGLTAGAVAYLAVLVLTAKPAGAMPAVSSRADHRLTTTAAASGQRRKRLAVQLAAAVRDSREHAALTSLVPRFGPATQALLAETKRHYDALVEASRREP
ncbi:MAG: hypothetical protein QOJ85_2252 [Solirubrobacteraceae bacterium]|jgi:hypothetical protein|nr:hypothetical protein [Solirubrobacteraceae bacterium]MEA2243431.1 hypothetical protein [Solirubrobacteraceae bacterium]